MTPVSVTAGDGVVPTIGERPDGSGCGEATHFWGELEPEHWEPCLCGKYTWAEWREHLRREQTRKW